MFCISRHQLDQHGCHHNLRSELCVNLRSLSWVLHDSTDFEIYAIFVRQTCCWKVKLRDRLRAIFKSLCECLRFSDTNFIRMSHFLMYAFFYHVIISSRHVISLRSKFLPQHSVLRHLQFSALSSERKIIFHASIKICTIVANIIRNRGLNFFQLA